MAPEYVIRLCELGELVFPDGWAEDEMECMIEVSVEPHVEVLSGDVGGM